MPDLRLQGVERGMDADVIIVGAGAAGLAAARRLAQRSLRVIVVEARDRAGGRVRPHHIAAKSAFAELGAEFIHGPAPETTALLSEIGVTAVETGGELWTRTTLGTLQRDDDAFRGAPALFERARAKPRDESVEQFLRAFANDPSLKETVEAARAFVEGFDAADPAIASARAIADEWASGVDTRSARPPGSYLPMFEHLQRACERAGARIDFSTAVRRIAWRTGAVSVDGLRFGKSQTLRARAAVVTLPVGVLRHRGDETAVTFFPELPREKREALAFIEMGHVVKVVLGFREPVLAQARNGRYRDAAFFRDKDQPFGAYWTQFPAKSRLVCAWTGGPKAVAMAGISHDERIELALRGFETLLDEPVLVRGAFEDGFTHDWQRDPLARGAYSYVAVGGGNARPTLASPLGNALFFAGEATSNDGQGGTVNGALETGERAAREVVAALDAARLEES